MCGILIIPCAAAKRKGRIAAVIEERKKILPKAGNEIILYLYVFAPE